MLKFVSVPSCPTAVWDKCSQIPFVPPSQAASHALWPEWTRDQQHGARVEQAEQWTGGLSLEHFNVQTESRDSDDGERCDLGFCLDGRQDEEGVGRAPRPNQRVQSLSAEERARG